MCVFGLIAVYIAEIIVLYALMLPEFKEATFLDVNTGFGYSGAGSLGFCSVYSTVGSILVCVCVCCLCVSLCPPPLPPLPPFF